MLPAILAGAAVGGQLLGNYLGNREREAAAREANKRLNEMMGLSSGMLAQEEAMYSPYTQYAQEGMQRLLSGDYTPEMGEFTFDEDVSKYLDPSLQFQLQQGTRSLDASAAGSGNLYSGAQQKALQQLGSDLGRTGYADAWARMQTSRGNAYDQYLNKFRAAQQNADQRYMQAKDILGVGMNAMGNISNARQSNLQSQMGILGNQAQIASDLQQKGWGDVVSNLTSPQNMAGFAKLFGG